MASELHNTLDKSRYVKEKERKEKEEKKKFLKNQIINLFLSLLCIYLLINLIK